MTNTLQSYAMGQWHAGTSGTAPIYNAVTGATLGQVSSDGLDFKAMLDYARNVGGPALRRETFHQRAIRLKEMAKYLMARKDEFYALSAATGATKMDSWIDIEGGISTLFVYSSKGRREMPNDQVYLDGNPEQISRHGTFTGQHICVPLEGAAVHINAFNFPCWGMLEKLAPTLLAGVPAIVKPATSTSYLTELMFRRMIESGCFPEGALQLICGRTGDLFEHFTCQDAVAFTGSAATGKMLAQQPAVVENSTRFTMEADSLNCSILGVDVEPGSPEFDLYIKEVVREMTVKAGQKCTAIRRAIVPADRIDAVAEALRARLNKVVVGDPSVEGVTMGSLASLGQREEVRERVRELSAAAEMVYGTLDSFDVMGADGEKGAFISPVVMHCSDPFGRREVHDIEAFGPVSTLMGYNGTEEAIELAKMGQGSLVGSIFTHDDKVARELVLGTAAWHGRLVLINRDCAKESTGHGSPLPHMIHGGPGRAGGGEEMGGIRGVLHYMQRTAIQGSPSMLGHVGGRWIRGGKQTVQAEHVFKKYFEDVQLGDTIDAPERTVTLEDVEHFAEFSGDKFYAHMNEEAAAANEFFEGRVAHGYFIVSAAAGLFVHPDPGPVLANYGLENLRFLTPFYPGDTMKVSFVCKQKINRETDNYGEIRWDTEITNQNDEVVAQYDVLTLVANKPS
ncbi:MAG: bifunctional aldehyde dehydrogenase/enoyl-CoA hydratase [Lysobacteraceae bacterium]|nr:MAG: bifunctional aldehyde dehydrogenase/enoyl-CoA hydratase [Xanthomonadaceae bacterium]